MSAKDYTEKVKEDRGLLERIMGYIPGYRGYKEKEMRRESDRLVRMDVVYRLKTAKTTFRRRLADPAAVQKLSSEDAYRFDAFTYRLDRVTQRVDRAVVGYAGMFDAIRVREDKLNSVIQYDIGLIEKAESIKADVDKVAGIQPGAEEWGTAMDALVSKVDEFDRFIDERAGILRGLQG
jgi:hypothetical protein